MRFRVWGLGFRVLGRVWGLGQGLYGACVELLKAYGVWAYAYRGFPGLDGLWDLQCLGFLQDLQCSCTASGVSSGVSRVGVCIVPIGHIGFMLPIGLLLLRFIGLHWAYGAYRVMGPFWYRPRCVQEPTYRDLLTYSVWSGVQGHSLTKFFPVNGITLLPCITGQVGGGVGGLKTASTQYRRCKSPT